MSQHSDETIVTSVVEMLCDSVLS